MERKLSNHTQDIIQGICTLGFLGCMAILGLFVLAIAFSILTDRTTLPGEPHIFKVAIVAVALLLTFMIGGLVTASDGPLRTLPPGCHRVLVGSTLVMMPVTVYNGKTTTTTMVPTWVPDYEIQCEGEVK